MKKLQFTKTDINVEWLNQEHWLRGAISADYDFIAKVLPEKSEFGMGGSRVVSFVLWNSRDKEAGALPVAEYYGNWTIQPEDETAAELVRLIVSRLEEEQENSE